MRYKLNETTTWTDTGIVSVYNYPPESGTFAYIKKIYRSCKEGVHGDEIVEGDAIYFRDLPAYQLALAIIVAIAQNNLNKTLPREAYLKPYKDE